MVTMACSNPGAAGAANATSGGVPAPVNGESLTAGSNNAGTGNVVAHTDPAIIKEEEKKIQTVSFYLSLSYVSQSKQFKI